MDILETIVFCFMFLGTLGLFIESIKMFIDLIREWREEFYSRNKVDNIVAISIFVLLVALVVVLSRK
jgi:hypothetical protein